MPATHGKDTRLWFNGYDVAAYFKTASVSKTVPTSETSTFNNTAKTYIPGLPDATFEADGLNDMASGASGSVIDIATGPDNSVVSYYPAGTALGAAGYGLQGPLTAAEYASPVDDVNGIKATFQSSVSAERILATASRSVVQASGTVAGTSTTLDNAAQTTAGWSAYLHATGNAAAFSVIVFDSADNSAFSPIGTITTGALTASTAVRFEATGTVRRYLRAVDTITAGTVTWQLGVSRTPYI